MKGRTSYTCTTTSGSMVTTGDPAAPTAEVPLTNTESSLEGLNMTAGHQRTSGEPEGFNRQDHRYLPDLANGLTRPRCSCGWEWGGYTTNAIAVMSFNAHRSVG